MKMMRLFGMMSVGFLLSAATLHAGEKAKDSGSAIINGKNVSWHVVSKTLKPGECYVLRLASSIKYSAAHKNPDRLHVAVKGAAVHEITVEGNNKPQIQEVYQFVAKSNELQICLKDVDPKDNRGKLRVTVRPCPGVSTGAPAAPATPAAAAE